jgi:hypothetical protein
MKIPVFMIFVFGIILSVVHFCVKDTIFLQLVMARVVETRADYVTFNGVFYLVWIFVDLFLTFFITEIIFEKELVKKNN